MSDWPEEIQIFIDGMTYTVDNIGGSADKVFMFEQKYVLKVSENIERLEREKERNEWLEDKLPVPRTKCFLIKEGKAYYLKTMLLGDTLINEKYLSNPHNLIELLSKAFAQLRSVDVKECPFSSEDNVGNDFIHGDFCLPNILVKDGEITGFLDMENCGRGDTYYDICWALWSLQYNIKTDKYHDEFLSLIGYEYNQNKYEEYIL